MGECKGRGGVTQWGNGGNWGILKDVSEAVRVWAFRLDEDRGVPVGLARHETRRWAYL